MILNLKFFVLVILKLVILTKKIVQLNNATSNVGSPYNLKI